MADLSTSTDTDLVQHTLAGGDDAFGELVRRYQQPVYACALSVTRNEQDAADAAQKTFIRLYRHLRQFDPERPLKPYLMTMAANCARNQRRSRQRLRWEQREEAQKAMDKLSDPMPAPDTQWRRRERAAAVRDMIAALPPKMQDVCTLFYVADRSCKDVGIILKMSESAVKTALHRARTRLREYCLADGRSWL